MRYSFLKIKEILSKNLFVRLVYYFFKYKYRFLLKPLGWVDLDVDEKIFLRSKYREKISSPNFHDNQSFKMVEVPDIFAYTLKNVVGCIESSNFYNNKKIFIERFQGIDQKNANYNTGHLMVSNDKLGLIIKYKDCVRLSGNSLFLGGNGVLNYFHWIIEILPKLLLLAQSSKILYSVDQIVVHKSLQEIESFSTSLSTIITNFNINIPIKYFDKDISIYFESVLYVTTFNHVLFNSRDSCKIHDCYFFKENLFLMTNFFVSHVNKTNICKNQEKFPEVFFIKRGGDISNYNKRNYNEEEIISLLKKYNVEHIYIEDYNFFEQIILFSNAKLIIAPSGAFLTNLIFCGEGTNVISWLPKKIKDFSVYSTLADFYNLNMSFLFAYQDDDSGIHEKYYLNPNSLKEKLDKIFDLGVI